MNLEILKQQKLKLKKKLNKFFKILFLSLGTLTSFQTYCADLIITTSGTYLLSDDILASGDATNGTIRIQSSYVTLDLGGCFIRQTDATANCTGIVVDANFTNLVIKNGTISGFTLNGISVGANCSKININNLIIENCTTAGAAGAGITVASGCSNVSVDSILISNCASSGIIFNTVVDSVVSNFKMTTIGATSSSYGLSLSSCNRIQVFNGSISNSSVTNGFLGFRINNSNNSFFKDLFVARCTNIVTLGCFYLNQASGCKLINCNIIDCSSIGLSGIEINTVSNCQFDQCSMFNNSGSFAYGFLIANSSGNVINQFRVIGNSFSNFQAIRFSNVGISYNNIFTECIISKNSTSGIFYGITDELSNKYNTFLNCIVSNNTSSGNLAVGLYGQNAAFSSWVVQDCLFEYNNGNTDANLVVEETVRHRRVWLA